MAMPTFDLSNILRKFIFLPGTGLTTYINPIRLFVTFALALGTLAVFVTQFFLDIQLPFSQPLGDFAVGESDIKSLLLYMVAADVLYDMLHFVVTVLASLIPFTITFFVSYFGIAFTYRLSSSFRSWILSLSFNK